MTQPKQRVFIVDDNPADIELTRLAFEEGKVPVSFEVADNGSEAVEFIRAIAAAKRDKPDLVILDLNLPRLNGSEVLAFARKQNQLRDLPIVMLTSSNAHNDRIRCMALGATEYLVKPDRFEDFVLMAQRLGRYLPGSDGPPRPTPSASPG